MIVISKYLPKRVIGLTVFPFVFLKQKDMIANVILINHERIDLRQQLELLILPFYVLYFFEFMYRLVQYKDRKKAYYNISFSSF